MREQDQVKALCEWAGWKWDEMSVHSPTGGKWSRYGRRFYEGGALEDDLLKILPDTNSLDVLHDFEKRLDDDQQEKYAHELSQVIPQNLNCGPGSDDEIDIMVHREFDLLHATAEQRRMALLKTIGKWTD